MALPGFAGKISRREFVKNSTLASIATTGIFTFLESCTKNDQSINYNDSISSAFRLSDHFSLLNLEFYFINCHYDVGDDKLTSNYGPQENYMIVRLPQQHIAETSFAPDQETFQATTYISGYSYLVFRILFPRDNFWSLDGDKETKSRIFSGDNGKQTTIKLTKEGLLDWGNEKKFRLVVRQDLTESLFELKKQEYYSDSNVIRFRNQIDSISSNDGNPTKIDSLKKLLLPLDSMYQENRYPFQLLEINNKDSNDSIKDSNNSIKEYSYKVDKIPRVYGDPVTAIEIPWRLIISPRLPDSSKFTFKWYFPRTEISDKHHKLWTATLSIVERTDTNYLNKKQNDQNIEKNKQVNTGSLNEAIAQLELMILGSPDSPDVADAYKSILPTGQHRKDLVALYIQLKVLARTEKLTFTPLGATTQIHLKNEKLEEALKKGIGVIEWNHIISLGREEKVEVSTLFLEAEFGHKMAYVEIAERELKNGVYPLIKRAYIMPLDITKDYTYHQSQKIKREDINKAEEEITVSRFNSPFKKITFLETKPKEYKNTTVYDPKTINYTKTYFEFEAIDWQGNVVKFKKQINALPFGLAFNKLSTTGKVPVEINGTSIESLINDTSLFQITKKVNIDSFRIDFHPTRYLDSIYSAKQNSINPILDSIIKNTSDLLNSYNKNLNELYVNISEEKKDNLKLYYDQYFDKLYKKSINDTIINPSLQDFIDFIIEKELFVNGAINPNLEKTIVEFIEISAQELSKWIETNTLLQKLEEFANNNSRNINIFEKKVLEVLQETTDLTSEKSAEIVINVKKLFLSDLRKDSSDQIDLSNFKSWIISLDKENTNIDKLYNHILISFPELARIIDDLKSIFEANAELIFTNIKNRIEALRGFENKIQNIPNIILLQKQKVGYAVREKGDEIKSKIIEKSIPVYKQVKKSLSEFETEYIIFEGALKQYENLEFDFFHEYAIIPQVTQAKVYISTLSKLVGEDIPISINYAKEYIESQLNELEFEAAQNAAMVFAEVQQASREEVKGLIKKIGDKMPGFNVEVPAHYLTYLKNPKELEAKFLDELSLDESAKQRLSEVKKDLVFISEEVKNAIKTVQDLEAIDPKQYFKDLGAKLFGSIRLEDILGVGFELPQTTELPDEITYQFSTEKFQENRSAFVKFKPNAGSGAATKLVLFISKSLKETSKYHSYTEMNNFSVGVILGNTEVLTVTFDKFKIISTPTQPKKTEVTIYDVKLGGPLEFIANLADKFMAPGNGMRIKPGPKNLSLFYGIAFPSISAPAFNFRNLQLNVGLNIPYDPDTPRPVSFTFGVNTPDNKFLVSAGIYGGRGHFQLRATPHGIENIDISIEMGAYASIELGIGRGEVFLFFGIWFVTGKDVNTNETLIKVVAYAICSGSATVLGFITIGVSVLIALTYEKRGTKALLKGEAVVTYSVKVAFFKKEFSIRYYKEIEGSEEGSKTTSPGNVGGGSILGASIFRKKNKIDYKEKTDFEDVFKNKKLLLDYIKCFDYQN